MVDKTQCPEVLDIHEWEGGKHFILPHRCILTYDHGKPPLNLRAHLTKVDGQLVRWGCGIQDGMKT